MNSMDEKSFEGTLVLEQLARVDAVDDFMAAVDAQDYARATGLMRRAGIADEAIAIVISKMADPYDEH